MQIHAIMLGNFTQPTKTDVSEYTANDGKYA